MAPDLPAIHLYEPYGIHMPYIYVRAGIHTCFNSPQLEYESSDTYYNHHGLIL